MANLTKEEILRIPQMVAEDKTYQEIAKELNRHPNTVNYWVRKLRKRGVKITPKHGPRPVKL